MCALAIPPRSGFKPDRWRRTPTCGLVEVGVAELFGGVQARWTWSCHESSIAWKVRETSQRTCDGRRRRNCVTQRTCFVCVTSASQCVGASFGREVDVQEKPAWAHARDIGAKSFACRVDGLLPRGQDKQKQRRASWDRHLEAGGVGRSQSADACAPNGPPGAARPCFGWSSQTTRWMRRAGAPCAVTLSRGLRWPFALSRSSRRVPPLSWPTLPPSQRSLGVGALVTADARLKVLGDVGARASCQMGPRRCGIERRPPSLQQERPRRARPLRLFGGCRRSPCALRSHFGSRPDWPCDPSDPLRRRGLGYRPQPSAFFSCAAPLCWLRVRVPSGPASTGLCANPHRRTAPRTMLVANRFGGGLIPRPLHRRHAEGRLCAPSALGGAGAGALPFAFAALRAMRGGGILNHK